VIQAGAIAQGGEIFVLDMGEPVKIVELARTMIKLSGFEPDVDIEIVYTGVRPGEKLFEEILTKAEGVDATKHERIFIGKANGLDYGLMEKAMLYLSQPHFPTNAEEAVGFLEYVIPGYNKFGATNEVASGTASGEG